MCGRYTLTTPGELIAELFDLSETPEIARPLQHPADPRGRHRRPERGG